MVQTLMQICWRRPAAKESPAGGELTAGLGPIVGYKKWGDNHPSRFCSLAQGLGYRVDSPSRERGKHCKEKAPPVSDGPGGATLHSSGREGPPSGAALLVVRRR